MKSLLRVALLFTLASCSQGQSYALLDGAQTNTADWQGQWTVINYWAIWCAPCRVEIPELNTLHAKDNGVQVLGINWDQPPLEQLNKVAQELDVQFPVMLQEPHEQFGYERPVTLPTTVLISPDGQVHKVLVGNKTEAALLDAMGLAAS